MHVNLTSKNMDIENSIDVDLEYVFKIHNMICRTK